MSVSLDADQFGHEIVPARTLLDAPTIADQTEAVRHADGDRLLVTVPEAAHLLHIGRRQAWEMVWRGELPIVRLGRSVRVARTVLERFVAERSVPYGA